MFPKESGLLNAVTGKPWLIIPSKQLPAPKVTLSVTKDPHSQGLTSHGEVFQEAANLE